MVPGPALNTINNYGALYNTGTIQNNGVINNLCGGVINNQGSIGGNPVNQIPCSLYFAQFGDGAQGEVSLSSELSLLNSDPNLDATATILLKDPKGQPLSLDLNGEIVNGQLEVMIPAGSVRRFASDGQGMIQAGSVTVTSNLSLTGVILFESNVGFAGVPSSLELPDGFLAPTESSVGDGIDTGVAVQNLEDQSVTLELQLFDEDRHALASASVMLPAMGQLARYVSQFDWEPEIDFSNFKGILKVTANGRLAATVILSRPDQFATLPVARR